MTPPPPPEAQAVLDFWLRETPPEKRFARDDALDAEIARRFGALHERLSREVPADWRADPQGLLAAVIVLDQFSRNLHRDDARAYAQDAAALTLTRQALAQGWDAAMDATGRQFLLLPLMHSESASDQAESVRRFEAFADADTVAFARRHAAAIARFGRFPARNATLGRANTPEEAAFLAAQPMGF